MAKAPPTEEQSSLKRRARRRLVGAIALVTVVAVVLPWVLEREPRSVEQQIAIQIPSPDAGKFAPKPPPEPAPAATAPDAPGPSSPAPAAATPAAADDSLRAEQDKVLAPPARPAAPKVPPKDKAAEKPAADAARKSADKAEPPPDRKPPAKPAADSKPFVVQVAALADADKAAEIQKALAAKGFRSYTEKVKTAGGEVTRVRVGPFPGREAAEKERARMKSLGFDGNVAPR